MGDIIATLGGVEYEIIIIKSAMLYIDQHARSTVPITLLRGMDPISFPISSHFQVFCR